MWFGYTTIIRNKTKKITTASIFDTSNHCLELPLGAFFIAPYIRGKINTITPTINAPIANFSQSIFEFANEFNVAI
jgi:hypothetical protein